MKKVLLILILALIVSSCSKNENPVDPGNNTGNYHKVLTVDTAGIKFELYSENSAILYAGYNNIGFKVFINGVEKKTGYVKYDPQMFHLSGNGHSTPVKEQFNYVDSIGLFKGYVCYSMLSDSTSFWYGNYNYNNEVQLNRKRFDVQQGVGNQMRIWLDGHSNILYYLTLISPKDPVVGLNDFKIILHQTTDNNAYTEVNNAQMFIRTWMPAHGHGSSNNTNPVFKENGIYQGKANLTMVGQWFVYDSILVNNTSIAEQSVYLVFDAR